MPNYTGKHSSVLFAVENAPSPRQINVEQQEVMTRQSDLSRRPLDLLTYPTLALLLGLSFPTALRDTIPANQNILHGMVCGFSRSGIQRAGIIHADPDRHGPRQRSVIPSLYL